MTDRLAFLLSRFDLQARVFHTGPLCQNIWFDAADGVGHLHLLRSGTLDIETGAARLLRIETPAMILYPAPTGHRMIPLGETGCDLVCATLDFGARTRNPLIRSLPGMVVIRLEDMPSLGTSLGLLFDEVMNPKCGRQALLDRLSEVVVIQTLRHVIDQGLVRDGVLAGLADARLCEAITAIHADPAQEWTLTDMAKRAGMSRARFAAHFRAVVGETPGAYLVRWRVSVAQTLLKEGRPLKLIAHLVGYANGSALTLSRFHVHQNVVNFLMKGERDGQEGTDIESAVHR